MPATAAAGLVGDPDRLRSSLGRGQQRHRHRRRWVTHHAPPAHGVPADQGDAVARSALGRRLRLALVGGQVVGVRRRHPGRTLRRDPGGAANAGHEPPVLRADCLARPGAPGRHRPSGPGTGRPPAGAITSIGPDSMQLLDGADQVGRVAHLRGPDMPLGRGDPLVCGVGGGLHRGILRGGRAGRRRGPARLGVGSRQVAQRDPVEEVVGRHTHEPQPVTSRAGRRAGRPLRWPHVRWPPARPGAPRPGPRPTRSAG